MSNLENGLAYRLETLAGKGEAAQSQSVDDIPWATVPVKVPFWLSRRSIAWGVSQFYHGEIATAALCRLIADTITCPASLAFLETQIADEERHARIYTRYLDALGANLDSNDVLKELHSAIGEKAQDPVAMVLATHVVLEGESLSLQQSLSPWLPCPLFAEISRVIARDEARHHAFGRLYLLGTLPYRPLSERLDYARWIKGFWQPAIRKAAGKLKPPGFQLFSGGWGRWLAIEWEERLDRLIAAGLLNAHERPLFTDP